MSVLGAAAVVVVVAVAVAVDVVVAAVVAVCWLPARVQKVLVLTRSI